MVSLNRQQMPLALNVRVVLILASLTLEETSASLSTALVVSIYLSREMESKLNNLFSAIYLFCPVRILFEKREKDLQLICQLAIYSIRPLHQWNGYVRTSDFLGPNLYSRVMHRIINPSSSSAINSFESAASTVQNEATVRSSIVKIWYTSTPKLTCF